MPDECGAGRDAARALLEAGHREGLWLVGEPDEKVIAKVSVALGARGSAKLRTLPAIDIDDFLRALED